MVSEKYITVNGIKLCYFEYGSELEEKPTYLLVHASGFHARCWDKTISHMQGCHVLAVDLRGHGRSQNHGPFSWDVFGADLTALLKALDLHNVVAVGHSIGGHVVCQLAGQDPSRFLRLLLIDPVICSVEEYGKSEPQSIRSKKVKEHPVSRRRNDFESTEIMFENYVGRGPFEHWQLDVLRDFCEFGSISREGRLILACPPVVEAELYLGSKDINIYPYIENIKIPVTVLRAQTRKKTQDSMDFSGSPTWKYLSSCFFNGRDISLPHLTHFIPMQNPELTAKYILDKL